MKQIIRIIISLSITILSIILMRSFIQHNQIFLGAVCSFIACITTGIPIYIIINSSTKKNN